jgi:hypothetical protein
VPFDTAKIAIRLPDDVSDVAAIADTFYVEKSEYESTSEHAARVRARTHGTVYLVEVPRVDSLADDRCGALAKYDADKREMQVTLATDVSAVSRFIALAIGVQCKYQEGELVDGPRMIHVDDIAVTSPRFAEKGGSYDVSWPLSSDSARVLKPHLRFLLAIEPAPGVEHLIVDRRPVAMGKLGDSYRFDGSARLVWSRWLRLLVVDERTGAILYRKPL